MRVVLDTNVLLVSIPKMSRYRTLFDALIEGKFTLIISNETMLFSRPGRADNYVSGYSPCEDY